MVEKKGIASEIKDHLIASEASEVVREKLEGHKGSVNSLDLLSSPIKGYFSANVS